MKYLKVTGLAAIAALAAMAFIGVSSASATTLCKVKESPCSAGNTYGAGTVFKGALKAGTKAVLKTSGGFVNPTVECTESSVAGKTLVASGKPLTGEITELKFKGCSAAGFGSCTVTENKLNYSVSVEAGATLGNGTMTVTKGSGGVNPGAKVVCEGISAECNYNAASVVLDVVGGTPAEVFAKEEPLAMGAFPCPSKSAWTATYTVSPSPLFVVS